MIAQGLLEGMAHRELDALLEEIRQAYRPGALHTLASADPDWREAVERTEREVGALYQALADADRTVGRWHQAVGDLRRLWRRVGETEPAGRASLDEVA
ncbi:MAG: hypothetical protein ACREMB_24170 [Candidatus Rokuibacteriota bacterium]